MSLKPPCVREQQRQPRICANDYSFCCDAMTYYRESAQKAMLLLTGPRLQIKTASGVLSYFNISRAAESIFRE